MARAERDGAKAAARSWLQRETRLGAKLARPVIAFGLAATATAIGQAWCAAAVLAHGLAGDGLAIAPAAAFAGLALLRAASAIGRNTPLSRPERPRGGGCAPMPWRGCSPPAPPCCAGSIPGN